MTATTSKPRLIATLFIMGFCLFHLHSCAPKQVDPLTMGKTVQDNIKAKYPPSAEELINKPSVLLPFVVFKDLTVTDIRQKTLLETVHGAFEKYSHFSIITQEQVGRILADNKFKSLMTTNVADAIHIGISANANYVSQIQLTILESQLLGAKDMYKANINLTVFKTDTGQVIFKTGIHFDSEDPEKAQTELKRLVQTYFRLKGYILETRGGQQAAKISLGMSMGIELNREFEIRERSITSELIEGGLTRQKITYLPEIIATGKVIKVQENESWILIKKEYQGKIKAGQVVFALPEKSGVLSFIDDLSQ